MTVKELIERLETVDPEAEVILEFWRDEGGTSLDNIERVFSENRVNGEKFVYLSTEEK